MRYLAAAIVLFIGVSADLTVYSAASSASASVPAVHTVAAGRTVHKVHLTPSRTRIRSSGAIEPVKPLVSGYDRAPRQ